MPNKNGKRKGKRNKNSSAKSAANLADLGMSVRDADHLIKSDLTLKPLSADYKSKPPRNIGNQIYYVRQTFNSAITTSTTTFVENNLSWSLTGALTQYAQYAVIFDQAFLHSASVTVTNAEPPGATATLPIVYTAIDFDSTTNLGSINTLVGYSTCNASTLAPGQSVTRFVYPCNKPAVGATAGTGVGRVWLDTTAGAAVPFNGIRLIVASTTASIPIDAIQELTWAFRNTI
jgi:hypothetical protein